jgi:hypothetical protein
MVGVDDVVAELELDELHFAGGLDLLEQRRGGLLGVDVC